MKSAVLQHDREEILALSRRLTPEERLVAYYHHSRLIAQMYQAGVRARAAKRPRRAR
jgi:hypothetical protein